MKLETIAITMVVGFVTFVNITWGIILWDTCDSFGQVFTNLVLTCGIADFILGFLYYDTRRMAKFNCQEVSHDL